MRGPANHTPAELLSGAIDWWREAGVDLHFAEEAQTWLAPEAEADAASPARAARPAVARPEPEQAAPPPLLAGRGNWPETLADFAPWWLSEPALDLGGAAPRVPPRGPARPDLMVLVAEPEADDAETLLSGPLGRFLAAMLDAAGTAPESVYLTSALPRNTPLADWSAAMANGLGEVTLHHIGLVAPERLIVFGRNILPLLGHDPAQNPASLLKINHQDRTIPVLAGWDLAALLSRTRARAAFWQRWLDWTDTKL